MRSLGIYGRFSAAARCFRVSALLTAATFVFAQAPEHGSPGALNNWPSSPQPQQRPGEIVSVDALRNPVPEKVRVPLLKALRIGDEGDHERAIAQMKSLRDKYPTAVGFIDNILGVEYIRTERFSEAAECFERAVALLPHDATTHSNLGLSLLGLGQIDRAELELRQALRLDPTLGVTRQMLDALLAAKRQLQASGKITVPPRDTSQIE